MPKPHNMIRVITCMGVFVAAPFLVLAASTSNDLCTSTKRIEGDPNSTDPETVLLTPAASSITVPYLSSNPQAQSVIYLDFDGEVIQDSRWLEAKIIDAKAYNLTPGQITSIWESVSEDFSPFNVDVTTDRSKYDRAQQAQRIHCIITPTDDVAPGAGGASYLGSFFWSASSWFPIITPCWVFNSNVTGIREAISHHVGHTLNLNHDGLSDGNDLFEGHGGSSSDLDWAPIMGAGSNAKVTQWSKGEYLDASNTEDDVAILSQGLGFRPGGPGNTRENASLLNFTNYQSIKGVITHSADQDYYRFTLDKPSEVWIEVYPFHYRPNLNIEVELQDSQGSILDDNKNDYSVIREKASFTPTLAAGTYYLRIKGAGYGYAQTNGYSSYGSIGQYNLHIYKSTLAGHPMIALNPAAQTTVEAGQGLQLRSYATGSPQVSYQWQLSTDRGSTWADLTDNAPYSGTLTRTLSISNASPAMNGYQYRLEVRNSLGSATSAPATLQVR